MRYGKEPNAVVAICVGVSAHSAEVAQNQPSIVVAAARVEDSCCNSWVAERRADGVGKGDRTLAPPGDHPTSPLCTHLCTYNTLRAV